MVTAWHTWRKLLHQLLILGSILSKVSGPIQNNNGREIWTREETLSYAGKITLQIWKDRNPSIEPHLNVTTVFKLLKKSEQILRRMKSYKRLRMKYLKN